MRGKGLYKNRSKFDRYAFGILLAIELIMSFTFLGYLHIPPISITIAYIPIIAAGCIFGITEAAVTGLFFGLGSMYKASAFYVMPADKVFSPFQSGHPVQSILLSVGIRVLFGFMIGLLFAWAKRRKHIRVWHGVISLIAPALQALLVFSAMGVFFPELDYSYHSAFAIRWSDLLIAAICFLCIELLYSFYNGSQMNRLKEAINHSNPYASAHIGRGLYTVGTFTVFIAIFCTVYFSQRAEYMLQEHGVDVSDFISHDLLHLQIQFLIAMLALNFILIVLLLLVYKYMSYQEYIKEMDSLTDVMGRRLFLYYCTKIQTEHTKATHENGWFLFFDVDYFKQINDTYGHTVGDEVLKQIGSRLKQTFESCGAVGRVGGDEFAAILEKNITKSELEKKLETFLSDISDILSDRTVSCSIGAYRFAFPKEIEYLLTETDHALYQAKENGRACFVIQEEAE